MRKTISTLATIAALATAGSAQAQEYIKPSYDVINGNTVLDIERVTQNTYAFIEILGKDFDAKSFFGKAIIRLPLEEGLFLGFQADVGSIAKDIAKISLGYKNSFGPVRYQARVAPIDTEGNPEVSIAAGVSPGQFNFSGWMDWQPNSTWKTRGELEARMNITGGLDAMVKGEKKPGTGYGLHFGGSYRL